MRKALGHDPQRAEQRLDELNGPDCSTWGTSRSAGLAMIDDAEARGTLRPGGTIIEPTAGKMLRVVNDTPRSNFQAYW